MLLRKKICKIFLYFTIVLSAVILTSCSSNLIDDINSNLNIPSSQTLNSKDILEIQYIDVGQADANLIKLPDSRIIMIDAGGNSSATDLVNNLKSQGIKKIDYLIATHPHEDHIGGMDNIIENFDIGTFYMPKVDDSQIPTTKTYEDVLTAVKNKNLKINQGKADMKIINETDILFDFIAPNSSYYDGLNSYSIVCRLNYGNKKFLFMGDAESDSEKEILNNNFNVKADVLKCGHHGSHSSSSIDFLKACNPSYAIISCSSDNKYGHPHKKTIDSLNKLNIKTYITANVGTITVKCDKENIYIDTEY